MKKVFVILIFGTTLFSMYAQKHDYNWTLGFGFSDTIEDLYKGNRVFVMKFGEAQLKFDTVFDSYYDITKQYLNFANGGSTSYSDINGELKYSTEGKRIYDASWNVMQNGDTINPGSYWNSQKSSYTVIYGVIAIPDPANAKRYSYLLHTQIIKLAKINRPMYSKIDFEGNNGLGTVIEKNIILNDTIDLLEQPMVVQHANGRDWWVFYHEYKTKLYYKKLLTPEGFIEKGVQEIGPDETNIFTGPLFSIMSHNGEKYCRYDRPGKYYLGDFDRCTGELSNFKTLELPDSLIGFGKMCFSPNDQFIYSTGQSIENLDNYLTQIDISTDPPTYKIIAHQPYSNTIECNAYSMLELGPDGKIYIGTASYSRCISIINFPDKVFPDCDFQEYLPLLPYFSGGVGMPHYPNYRLGPLVGSVCDTITSTQEINDPKPIAITYPNPAIDKIKIELMSSLHHSGNLEVSLIDVSGKLLYSGKLPPYAYIHQIDVKDLVPGMYCVLIRDKLKLLGSVKVVKQ